MGKIGDWVLKEIGMGLAGAGEIGPCSTVRSSSPCPWQELGSETVQSLGPGGGKKQKEKEIQAEKKK